MLDRSTFTSKFPGVETGTVVYSEDGEKLGKVVALDEDSFVVEKGIFFPRDFTARYDDIIDFRNGELILNQRIDNLKDWKMEAYSGWDDYSKIEGDTSTGSSNLDSYNQRKDDVTVQLTEEQLEARKTMEKTGEVRLRKTVHTEMKNISVPVMREEVTIERTPVAEGTPSTGNSDTFPNDGSVSIPVMEEQVELVKKPVIKEEVRLKKETHIDQKNVSGEVRKEDVEIEGDIEPKRKAG